MKERGCMAPDDRNPDNNDRNHDRNCRILVNIVTMEDLSLRGNVYRDGQHLRYDFCCDEIIGKILWELIDNPYAAEALGAGDLGDLVELLEVAARCESKESHIRQRDLKVGFSQLVSCQSANIHGRGVWCTCHSGAFGTVWSCFASTPNTYFSRTRMSFAPRRGASLQGFAASTTTFTCMLRP